MSIGPQGDYHRGQRPTVHCQLSSQAGALTWVWLSWLTAIGLSMLHPNGPPILGLTGDFEPGYRRFESRGQQCLNLQFAQSLLPDANVYFMMWMHFMSCWTGPLMYSMNKDCLVQTRSCAQT